MCQVIELVENLFIVQMCLDEATSGTCSAGVLLELSEEHRNASESPTMEDGNHACS